MQTDYPQDHTNPTDKQTDIQTDNPQDHTNPPDIQTDNPQDHRNQPDIQTNNLQDLVNQPVIQPIILQNIVNPSTNNPQIQQKTNINQEQNQIQINQQEQSNQSKIKSKISVKFIPDHGAQTSKSTNNPVKRPNTFCQPTPKHHKQNITSDSNQNQPIPKKIQSNAKKIQPLNPDLHSMNNSVSINPTAGLNPIHKYVFQYRFFQVLMLEMLVLVEGYD